MTDGFDIFIGYEGPTDGCLGISSDTFSKEFLIESPEWQLLSLIRDSFGWREGFKEDYQDMLGFIWKNANPKSMRS